MAVRTTSTLVKGVLAAGQDYDLDLLPDLTPYIDAANSIVTQVAACALRKGITYSPADLELIERWVAAHTYAMSDQTYASKSTGGQSASFQGQTRMYYEATKYGQMAKSLDYANCLIVKRASAAWLGKTAAEALDWEARN